MDALKLKTPWNETSEKLKEVNMALTDDDLQLDESHPEEMIRRVAARLRRDENYVKDWIESVSANKRKAS